MIRNFLKKKKQKIESATTVFKKNWGDQKWTTKSGKKSSVTGERYLPKKAIDALSPQEYAATTKAKRAGKAKGKQFVAQPKNIAKKTAGYR